MSSSSDDLTGGCQCGAVRYRIAATERPTLYACHCHECQKQSASAFGMSLAVRVADFAVTGTLARWERSTDSGGRMACHFCPACGSRIFHQRTDSTGRVTVKAGTLDDTAALVPDAYIWVSRKQPWVLLDPDVPAHDTQPADFRAWRREVRA